jgi:hypothetical protein
MKLIQVARNKARSRASVNSVMNMKLSNYQLLKADHTLWR